MVVLISLLDVVEYFEGLFCRCRLNQDFLEPALQCSVFLNGVAIFIEGCCANALYGASCQCWFHDVCGIHCACCATGTNQSVYLVDKYNDVRVLLQFFQECLNALLKLSAILRTCHHSSHVKVHHALSEQHWRCLSFGYHLCQTFHYGALANSRLAYEDRVVLLSSAQYLHHALHLLSPAHDGVKFTFACCLSKVGCKVVYHRCLAACLFCLCLACGALFLATVAACRHGAFLLVLFGEVNAVGSLAFLLLEERQRVIICHVVHFQDGFHSVFRMVVQHGKQQVLLVHNLHVLYPCFEHSQFQDVACLLVDVEFRGEEWFLVVVLHYLLFERLFHVVHVNVHDGEEVLHGAVLASQYAEHHVLWSYGNTRQSHSLLLAEGEYF